MSTVWPAYVLPQVRLARLIRSLDVEIAVMTLNIGAEPGTPIPTCPEWTLTDLVDHVGATQRWVSRLVGEGIDDPGTAFSIGWETAPADPSDWDSWLLSGARGVEATFAGVPDDRVVWDPSGGGDGVAFWSQRIFGEISVHRIDAAFALERDYQIEPTLAAAAIEDWLANMASSGWAANVPGFVDGIRGHGQTIAWVADDADQAWLLRRTEAPLVLTHLRSEPTLPRELSVANACGRTRGGAQPLDAPKARTDALVNAVPQADRQSGLTGGAWQHGDAQG